MKITDAKTYFSLLEIETCKKSSPKYILTVCIWYRYKGMFTNEHILYLCKTHICTLGAQMQLEKLMGVLPHNKTHFYILESIVLFLLKKGLIAIQAAWLSEFPVQKYQYLT